MRVSQQVMIVLHKHDIMLFVDVCLCFCLQKERITFGRSHSDNEDEDDDDNYRYPSKAQVKCLVPKVVKKVCYVAVRIRAASIPNFTDSYFKYQVLLLNASTDTDTWKHSTVCNHNLYHLSKYVTT